MERVIHGAILAESLKPGTVLDGHGMRVTRWSRLPLPPRRRGGPAGRPGARPALRRAGTATRLDRLRSGAERPVTTCPGGEPGGACHGLVRQRPAPVRELRGHRGGLVETFLVEHRRAVAAQADLRERGELGRELLRGGQRLAGRHDAVGEPDRCRLPASTARPVRIMSSARLVPISRGSRTVPPSISGTPQRRQKTPNTAVSSATRRSHHSASSRPPATAYPDTAAMTGLDSRSRLTPIGPSPSGAARLPRSVPMAVRSAPAQKTPPVPCSTATAASGSASKARKAPASAAAAGPSTALRRSGRCRQTVVTGPDRSTRTA